MRDQLVFLVKTDSHTVFTSAAESLLRARYPGAEIRKELTEDRQRRKRAVRVELAGTGRWLLLGGDVSAREAADAIAAGAWAVLAFDLEPGDFERGLDALVDGDEPFFPAELMQRIADSALRARPGIPYSHTEAVTLTARERDVLGFVALGHTNAEIAAQLSMSANTVRTHLQSLSSKFHAQGRLRMVARARELGVLDAPPSAVMNLPLSAKGRRDS